MSQSPLPATSATLAAAQPGAAGEAGLVASGRRVLEIEGQALAAVGARIGDEFARACRLVMAGHGRVVATGMGTLAANVTNSVSTWPGYVGSVGGFREELRRQRHRLRRLAVATVLGSAVGCALLLATPTAAFDAIVTSAPESGR